MLIEYNNVTYTINQKSPNLMIKLLLKKKDLVPVGPCFKTMWLMVVCTTELIRILYVPATTWTKHQTTRWQWMVSFLLWSPGTCWTGGCVGLRASLDVAMNRLCPQLELNPGCLLIQPIAKLLYWLKYPATNLCYNLSLGQIHAAIGVTKSTHLSGMLSIKRFKCW